MLRPLAGRRGRSRLLLVGWGLVLAGCTSSAGADPASSTFVVAEDTSASTSSPTTAAPVPPTSATTTPPTTTAPTSTTLGLILPEPVDGLALTDPAAPAPVVDLVAETWAELVGVWSNIDAYWTWLNAHPTDDPEVLAVIFDPAGPEFEEQLAVYETLTARSWRIVASSTLGQVVGFGCCPDPNAQMATGAIDLLVETRTQTGDALVVDDKGDEVSSFASWDRRTFRLRLLRGDDGLWRVWLLE